MKRVAVPALAVLALLVLAGCSADPPTRPSTAVHRGSVTRTVSATGALSGVSEHSSVAVVPFAEVDATAIHPGQRVGVVVDAVPGPARPGTVLAVAPSAVTISGVTSYYVTIEVPGGEPGLSDGQTVRVSASRVEASGVLVVPNAAVFREGGRSYVDTLGAGGQLRRTAFTPGAVGDVSTQVRSGLSEGQRVLLP